LQIEKSLGNQASLQLGYVGSDAHKLNVMENINQNNAFNTLYPNVGSILQLNSNGNSNYNAFQAILKLHSWHGLTGQFSYTWAHALDNVTEYRGSIPFDSFNLRYDYGNSDFDTRNNFVGYWTYNIPGSKHGPAILTHGWQIGGLLSFHGGQPFNFPGTTASGTQRPGLDVIANPWELLPVSQRQEEASNGSTRPRSVCRGLWAAQERQIRPAMWLATRSMVPGSPMWICR
jgi:hypothetical protein